VAKNKFLLPLIAGWLSAFTQPANAEEIKVYRSMDHNGVVRFSDQAPADRQYTLLRYRCFACGAENKTDFSNTPLFLHQFGHYIEQASQNHTLDSALIRAVIHAESGFNANAISKRGAMGLMQIMPATATDLKLTNPYDPAANIVAGSAYLAGLIKQFDGQLELALAAYNAGPQKVLRYQRIPPYAETQNYVRRVRQLLKRYQQNSAPPATTG